MGVAGAMRARDQDVVRKPSACGSAAIFATSQRAIDAAAARVSAAAAPVVTSPASAPVASAMRLARGILQFADIDRGARGRGHRRHHFGRHHRAAQPGQRAGGIDAAANAETFIGIGDPMRSSAELSPAGQTRPMIATGPPPAGPWCSAPPET